MTVYKTILSIIKKNTFSLSIGLIITLSISILLGQQIAKQNDLTELSNIAVIDHDNSELSKGLIDYIASNNNLVQIDEAQTSQDDALFFNQVDYILTIQSGFSSELLASENTDKLLVQTQPNNHTKGLIDNEINNFISTLLTFKQAVPDNSLTNWLELTNKNLDTEDHIKISSDFQKNQIEKMSTFYFNLLSYGLFSTIFILFTTIQLTFKKREISLRNACAPIPKHLLNSRITTACLSFSVIVFLVFISFTFINAKVWSTNYRWPFLINSLVFLTCMISFSTLISSILKTKEAVTSIHNIFILGVCFISGVFVPQNFLPEIVHKISSFFPTYWFVKNNSLIISNQANTSEFKFYLLILAMFTVAFLVLTRIVQIDRSRKII